MQDGNVFYTGGKMDKGQRVELHPTTDAWMQGDRFGTVIGYGRKIQVTERDRERDTNVTYWVRPIRVKLDKSGRVRRFHPDNVLAI